MSALDKIRRGKRLTADFLYELLYGIANGDLATQNNNLPYWRNKDFYDHVIEGCVWTGDNYGSTLLASMTAGLVMINGKVVSVDAIANRAFTASKDTYHYIDENGASTFTEVSNNAASPTAVSNAILNGIIVTAAGSITAATQINQGQGQALVPVISSQYLRGCDSNGVPIYNTNPIELTFGRYGVASPAPTSLTDVAGATVTFTLAKSAKVYIDYYAHYQLNSGATRNSNWQLYIDGSLVDGLYAQDNPGSAETHLDCAAIWDTVLAAGAHTVKLRVIGNTGGTIAVEGGFRIRIR